MSMEVLCLIWFAILLTEMGLNDRLSRCTAVGVEFYMDLIGWIKDAGVLQCDKTKFKIPSNEHKIIRTFSINKVLLMSAAQISSLKTEWHRNGKDEELLEFMDDKHNDLDNIHDVKWCDFRQKTDDPSMRYANW